eukprot:c17248_g2_i1 orf=481-1926(-)
MAVHPGSGTSASATATLVGNAFVNQYYNVLHQSPHNVHRFYTDQSKLSRSEAGTNADIVETQDKIQEKIMSMDLDGVQAEIKTVDSLASLNGSVLVMVTGSLSSRSGLQRNFVQTFFLAPQEKGYFVLSDICRFLDGVGDQLPNVPNNVAELNMIPNIIEQEQEVSLEPSQQDAPDPVSHVEERDLTESFLESVVEEEVIITPDKPVEDDTSLVDNAPSYQEPVVGRSEEQLHAVKEESSEGATKMSYASILREAAGVTFTTRQVAPRKVTPTQTVPVASTTVSQGVPQATMAFNSAGPSNGIEDGVSDGGDGLSVYVKNLPLNISQEDLEKEFQKFGSVKPEGVNLRNQKQGVCFAFIQFEDSSSVRSAIEASPISIGGRQVYVEEKKPTSMGPSAGRGRAVQGRGYQAEGMNGRGNFGGRSFGRGGYNSERDFNSRGRGGRGNYGAANYGSNGNSVNGYRRADSNVGNGSRPQRRGATD